MVMFIMLPLKQTPGSHMLFEQSLPRFVDKELFSEWPGTDVWCGLVDICHGVPALVRTLAGFVASNPKKTIEDWAKTLSCLTREIISSAPFDDYGRATKLLNYFHSDMPAYLKTCSLYLSMFPKDCRISRSRLIRRWIAEGFVDEKQGVRIEDEAEAYFSQLLERRIIVPAEHSSGGGVKVCRVESMVME